MVNGVHRKSKLGFLVILCIALLGIYKYVNDVTEPQATRSHEFKATSTSSALEMQKYGDDKNAAARRDIVANFAALLNNRTDVPFTVDADFLVNPADLCPTHVDYLIMVHSAPHYFDRRRVMRQTYGARNLFDNVVQRVVFLIGQTSDKETANQIQAEAEENGDIVQGPFVDSYHNLTLKGVMGLRWVSLHCPQTNVLIKIDDDIILNVFRVVTHLLPKFTHNVFKLGCDAFVENRSRIMREGKWKVDEFPGLKTYPFGYCKGYFVAIPGIMVRPMLDAARITPFFWVDDAYLFGMLPAVIGDVVLVHYETILDYNLGRECLSVEGFNCRYFAVTPTRHFPFPAGMRKRCALFGYKPKECLYYLRSHWTVEEFRTLWSLMSLNVTNEIRNGLRAPI